MLKPSAKLVTAAKLTAHHLATDNAQPLKISGDRELVPNPDAPVTPRAPDLPRDRIVIYSAFPSSAEVIIDVSVSESPSPMM